MNVIYGGMKTPAISNQISRLYSAEEWPLLTNDKQADYQPIEPPFDRSAARGRRDIMGSVLK